MTIIPFPKRPHQDDEPDPDWSYLMPLVEAAHRLLDLIPDPGFTSETDDKEGTS